MTRRPATLRSLAVLLLASACFSIDAPPGGIAAITNIIAPSPSVIVGEDSRDSTGATAPLRVYAFAENGDTIRDVTVQFVVLGRGLTVDANGIAHGDSVVPSGVQVVATIGSLQTQPFRLPVTVAPLRTRQEDAARIEFPEFVTDTMDSRARRDLTIVVSGDAAPNSAPQDTTANGFLVDYEIVDAPESSQSDRATAVLLNGSKASTRDTTGVPTPDGRATRTLQLRPMYFQDPDVLNGNRPDTVVVEVTVRHAGSAVAGTPVTFIVPVCLKKDPATAACTAAP